MRRSPAGDDWPRCPSGMLGELYGADHSAMFHAAGRDLPREPFAKFVRLLRRSTSRFGLPRATARAQRVSRTRRFRQSRLRDPSRLHGRKSKPPQLILPGQTPYRCDTASLTRQHPPAGSIKIPASPMDTLCQKRRRCCSQCSPCKFNNMQNHSTQTMMDGFLVE